MLFPVKGFTISTLKPLWGVLKGQGIEVEVGVFGSKHKSWKLSMFENAFWSSKNSCQLTLELSITFNIYFRKETIAAIITGTMQIDTVESLGAFTS